LTHPFILGKDLPENWAPPVEAKKEWKKRSPKNIRKTMPLDLVPSDFLSDRDLKVASESQGSFGWLSFRVFGFQCITVIEKRGPDGWFSSQRPAAATLRICRLPG
jgi:hypothetical protein